MLTGTCLPSRGLWLPEKSIAGPFSGDKIFWHADKLAMLRDGKIPPPVGIELDITNVCNLACPYCTNTVYNSECQKTLPTDTVKQVLLDCAHMGCKAVCFTGGGEPTVHKDIGLLMEYAQELGMDTALITNATLLHRAGIPPHVLMKCEWIRISLDAHDQESYYLSKGRDHWDQVIANISALVEVKRNYIKNVGPNTHQVTIGVGYLTTPDNYKNMEQAAEAISKLGVDYLQFRPVIFMPDDDRAEMYPLGAADEIMPYIEAARQYSNSDFQVVASMPKYEDLGNKERGYSHCLGVYFSCVIGATGDTWICCHMRGYPEFSLGSVLERRFSDIWYDVQLRNEIYQRIGDFSKCMPLCRFHSTNKSLSRLNFRPAHVNFL